MTTHFCLVCTEHINFSFFEEVFIINNFENFVKILDPLLGKISNPKAFLGAVVGVYGILAFGTMKAADYYFKLASDSAPDNKEASPAEEQPTEDSKPANEKKSPKKASVSENQADTK